MVVTPYNLPPDLCMKEEFMFLTVLVPGPTNPKGEDRCFLAAIDSGVEKSVRCWGSNL